MNEVKVTISGYRQLSAEEQERINRIKAVERALLQLVGDTRDALERQAMDAHDDAEIARLRAAEPARWASIARTHFQEGFMALVRAVAQPAS